MVWFTVAHTLRVSLTPQVRRLASIRHENLVLYMGTCLGVAGGYSIVTSAVRADSLHRRLSSSSRNSRRAQLSVERKVSVARQLSNALGYLHSRGVAHGRLSAHNVFLESKVQLSLIDYAQGASNAVYSSPQVGISLFLV